MLDVDLSHVELHIAVFERWQQGLSQLTVAAVNGGGSACLPYLDGLCCIITTSNYLAGLGLAGGKCLSVDFSLHYWGICVCFPFLPTSAKCPRVWFYADPCSGGPEKHDGVCTVCRVRSHWALLPSPPPALYTIPDGHSLAGHAGILLDFRPSFLGGNGGVGISALL